MSYGGNGYADYSQGGGQAATQGNGSNGQDWSGYGGGAQQGGYDAYSNGQYDQGTVVYFFTYDLFPDTCRLMNFSFNTHKDYKLS